MPDRPGGNIIPFRHAPDPGVDPNALLSARDLRLRKGHRTLLEDISFDISADGITTVLGPNGAGKSLLLRLIAGLETPDEGSLMRADPHPDCCALVFQSPVVLRRSVSANLDHALKIYGTPRKERTGRIAELLVLADLTHLAAAQARTLSGGEKQRLAMARALAARPSLLLLDEPTASLDPHATASIERLTRTASSTGTKVILVTHDWAQAKRLSEDVLFLNRGRVTEHSAAPKFFERPASEEGRTYLEGQILL